MVRLAAVAIVLLAYTTVCFAQEHPSRPRYAINPPAVAWIYEHVLQHGSPVPETELAVRMGALKEAKSLELTTSRGAKCNDVTFEAVPALREQKESGMRIRFPHLSLYTVCDVPIQLRDREIKVWGEVSFSFDPKGEVLIGHSTHVTDDRDIIFPTQEAYQKLVGELLEHVMSREKERLAKK